MNGSDIKDNASHDVTINVTDYDIQRAKAFIEQPMLFVTGSELYITLAMLAILALIGTVGNLGVLRVFGGKRERTSSNVFIVALAAIDVTTCALVIPATFVMEITHFKIHSDVLCMLYQFLNSSSVTMSAFVMGAIAVDRYLCICWTARVRILYRHAKITVVVLAVSAGILGLFVALCHGTRPGKITVEERNTSERYRETAHENLAVTDTFGLVGKPLSTYGNVAAPVNGCRGGACDAQMTSLVTLLGANASEAVLEDVGVSNTVGNNTNHPPEAAEVTIQVDYEGICRPVDDVISSRFRHTLQVIHVVLFLVVFCIICVMYAMLYRRIRQQLSMKSVIMARSMACRTRGRSPPPQRSVNSHSDQSKRSFEEIGATRTGGVPQVNVPETEGEMNENMVRNEERSEQNEMKDTEAYHWETGELGTDFGQKPQGFVNNSEHNENTYSLEPVDKVEQGGLQKDATQQSDGNLTDGDFSGDRECEGEGAQRSSAPPPDASVCMSDVHLKLSNGSEKENKLKVLLRVRCTKCHCILNVDGTPENGFDDCQTSSSRSSAPGSVVRRNRPSPTSSLELNLRHLDRRVIPEENNHHTRSSPPKRLIFKRGHLSSTTTETSISSPCSPCDYKALKGKFINRQKWPAKKSQSHSSRRSAHMKSTPTQRISKAKEHRLARSIFFKENVKIAIALFIVTVVYVVTYLPGALMTNKVVPLNIPVFYMYFINNVANPIIFLFSNSGFRQALRQYFRTNRAEM